MLSPLSKEPFLVRNKLHKREMSLRRLAKDPYSPEIRLRSKATAVEVHRFFSCRNWITYKRMLDVGRGKQVFATKQ